MKNLVAVLLVAILLSMPGCSEPTKVSPLDWSKAELEDFVKENAGFSELTLNEVAGASRQYSGQAIFENQEMDCTVNVSDNRVSWEAESERITTVDENGFKSTSGGAVAGSRSF